MALRIVHSNRVERLLEELAGRLRTPPEGAGLLEPETVLVDNPVLGSWINLRVALRNSVAANIRYVQPAELFWELARAVVDPSLPERTPLDKAELGWRIFDLLGDPEALRGDEFLPVRAYLDGDGGDGARRQQDLKRYQLAAAVADLYDQYLVYRPRWINAAWDRGEQAWPARDETGGAAWLEAEAWQRSLWRRLQPRGPAQDRPPHRAAVFNRLMGRLQDAPESGERLREHGLRRLSVFGITAMPETQLDLLMLLGNRIEVDLYLFNPCRHAWFHIRSARQIARLQAETVKRAHWDEALDYLEIGHPLLASQATQVREFVELILDKAEQFPYREEEAFEVPPDDSLLGGLQRDLLELEFAGDARDGAPRAVPPRERDPGQIQSVHFHDCHSPMREVEVLHDQLLDMFEKLPGLKPRDVVVMMPRVATYAPYIHAVFGSAPPERFIDYHITDRSLREESPLLNSFETLLRLDESRLPLSEVLSVLEVPAVRRRFGLDREGFEQARRWLVEAGVRWGADAAHRAELGLPAYAEFSWEFGFHRLLAGYGMAGDELVELGGRAGPALRIAPLDEVEGGTAETLDGLLRFWRALRNLRRGLRGRRTLEAWHALIVQLQEGFYAPADEDWRAIGALRTQLAELETAHREGWHRGEVPVSVVREAMSAVLRRNLPGRHPWSEGVKFCSLLPMRGVPFRVVCLLGMNLDDYPRRVERRSFDLMRDDHRPGDRSARADDRWLFLEALLSARDVFHVSFLGRGVHRNETLQPSVVVSELIDTLRRGFDLPEAFDGRRLKANSIISTQHPLQPFDRAYFRPPAARRAAPSPRLLSFNRQAFEVARAGARRERPVGRWAVQRPAADETLEVAVEDFLRFFSRPWEAFFRARQVWFEAADETVRDEEDFEVEGGLERWQLNNELLQRASARTVAPEALEAGVLTELRDREVSALVERRRAAGAWPLGSGGLAAAEKLGVIDPGFLFAGAGRPVRRHDLALEVTAAETGPDDPRFAVRIAGSLRIVGEGLLVHTVSQPAAGKLLDFYLRAMLADAAGAAAPEAWRALFLGKNGKAAPVFRFKSGDITAAFPLVVRPDPAASRALLRKLGALYAMFRARGLPFEPELGLHWFTLRDREAFGERVEDAWNAPYTGRPLRADLRTRSYFGNAEALLDDEFLGASDQVWSAIEVWLQSVGGTDGEQDDG